RAPTLAGALCVHGARGARAVAGFGDVADAPGSTAHRARGHEAIRRTLRVVPAARFLEVARSGDRPAHGSGGHELLHRARAPGAVAGLLDVAASGHATTDEATGPLHVGGARIVDAVADLCDVAVAHRGTTLGEALHILRAARRVSGAVLCDVAGTSRRATDCRDVTECVGRTVRCDSVTGLHEIAGSSRLPTDRAGLRGSRDALSITAAVVAAGARIPVIAREAFGLIP